ncbi:MAG: polysaccharide biosynthesis/export family protein [Opitutales bacterium]
MGILPAAAQIPPPDFNPADARQGQFQSEEAQQRVQQEQREQFGTGTESGATTRNGQRVGPDGRDPTGEAALRSQRLNNGFDAYRLLYPDTDVFGAHLFQGAFSQYSFTGFNPNYLITVGDEIRVQVWGAVEIDLTATVDPQGNLFLPQVGPIAVEGIRNADLNDIIKKNVGEVFIENVQSYANLVTPQPVRVYVTGMVTRPGLYAGFSADSVLYYLDSAGGIDPERGSFIDVRVLRDGELHREIDLYSFLTEGKIEHIQFQDGDTVFVAPLRNTVTFTGDLSNPYQFEFAGPELALTRALDLAQPLPSATHAIIGRKLDGRINSEYVPFSEADNAVLRPGDSVEVFSDLQTQTIRVTIEGEQRGPKQIVLPQGSQLSDAQKFLETDAQGDAEAIQLFRQSVAERQKAMLETSLENLERNILSARSSSTEEANLRRAEAELLLQFIERAKEVEPKGQVILSQAGANPEDIFLEDGDILFIPKRTQLISVHGEVNFPNTQVFQPDLDMRGNIDKDGGFTYKAEQGRIVIHNRNGASQEVRSRGFRRADLEAGDEVVVMSKTNLKTLQFSKDVTQIIFQIAVAARAILDI